MDIELENRRGIKNLRSNNFFIEFDKTLLCLFYNLHRRQNIRQNILMAKNNNHCLLRCFVSKNLLIRQGHIDTT
ncbi:hypothetical protein HZS_5665 [Henneguya salminicola]|nr:hypothetical protein HZS_5665 [Henneguya salminicola]